jgi:MFS transporter, PPP family, 3-phenylpropionic acid transporter
MNSSEQDQTSHKVANPGQPLASSSVDDELTTENQMAEPLLAVSVTQRVDEIVFAREPTPSARGLLFYRSIYFLSGLSASAWGRFGIIYYNEVKHLNPAQIGVLSGVNPIVGFVIQPIWGYIADTIQSRKLVFVICRALSTLFLLSLSLDVVSGFWAIFGIVTGLSCFNSGGVLDAHTLDFLGEAHRGMYGSIRLWNAVSWGLGAVIMGWITDTLGFQMNFVLFGSMMLMTLGATMFGLPTRSRSEQELYDRINNTDEGDVANSSSSRPKIRVLRKAILRLPVCLWLFEVAIIGAGMGIVDSFLFVYLQNQLNASTELCGYSVGVTVLLELPIFHFSDFLLSRLGHDALFILSMLAYSTRVIGYTFLTPTTVWWVLLLEFSHGITFACMWISSIDYATVVAPKEWSTSVQSLLSTALTCVGGGLGPVLGGLVMERYGPYVMFRGIGVIVASLLLVHSFVLLVLNQGHDKFLAKLKTERQSGVQSIIDENSTDVQEAQ